MLQGARRGALCARAWPPGTMLTQQHCMRASPHAVRIGKRIRQSGRGSSSQLLITELLFNPQDTNGGTVVTTVVATEARWQRLVYDDPQRRTYTGGALKPE